MLDAPFLTFCATVGADPEWIQGAGGNASFKEGDTLRVKCSGTQLADALQQEIFVPVSRNAVLAMAASGNENFSALAQGDMKPSIETPIHALLPQKYVFHLHYLDAIIFSALKTPVPKRLATGLLADLSIAVTPYARPGLPLYKALHDTLKQCTITPDIVILQNHGIIVAGDSLERISCLLEEVRRSFRLPVRSLSNCDHARLSRCNNCGWDIPAELLPHAPAFGTNALALCGIPPLYPDHVVFLGPATLVLEEGQSLSRALLHYERTHGCPAKFAVLPGAGVMTRPGLTRGEQAMLEAFARIALRVPNNARLATLTPKDVDALLHWDAEKWRQSLDASEK